MIKVEMQTARDQDTGELKSKEHIWLAGQPWPVLEADDTRIARLEAFGLELQECLQHSHATGKAVLDSNGNEVCRTWYMQDAANVSRNMRQRHP